MLINRPCRASGLGRACCEEIVANGGHVAVLDQDEKGGQELVNRLGPAAKFFYCNVLETESISEAVEHTEAWANETGKAIGGAITAAGVARPAHVSRLCLNLVIYTSDRAGLTSNLLIVD